MTVDNSEIISAIETLKASRVIKKDIDIATETGFSQPVISNYLANRVKASKNFKKIFFEKYGQYLKRNISDGDANAIALDMTQSTIMMVPLVSQYAYAGYLSGFSDQEYIQALPSIPMIADREHKGKYMAFEVKGDSMDDGTRNGYESGNVVIGRQLSPDHWRSKLHFKKYDFVIVHKTEGVTIKKIIAHDVETGIITCHPLNPEYSDFDLNLNEVAQIFNIVQVVIKK